MSIKDAAADGVREQVRQAVAQAWREPVSVLYLRKVKTEYHVPGRREDGTVKGKRLMRRFFRNLFRTLLIPVDWSMGGDGTGAYSTLFREGEVRGPADCAALPVADIANQARQDLWLVWSASRLALMHADAKHPPRILWSEVGAQRPGLDLRKATLTWPDGSHLAFGLSLAEQQRVRQLNGAC